MPKQLMKLYFTFAAIYFLLLNSQHSFAQLNPEQNSKAALYSQNKIKCVKVYTYRTKKMKGKGKITSYTNLDTLGREIEAWTLLDLGFMYHSEFHRLYAYNKHGDLEKETAFVIKNSDPLITTYDYKYDDQQRITFKKVNRRFDNAWQYEYDPAGNLIRTKWYLNGDEGANSFFFIDSFSYSGNILMEMKRYRPDHSLYFHFIYEHDEQGNRIKETRFEHGRVTDVWQRTFDGNGNCIQLVYMDKLTGEETISRSQYNEQGLPIFAGKKRKFVYEYY